MKVVSHILVAVLLALVSAAWAIAKVVKRAAVAIAA